MVPLSHNCSLSSRDSLPCGPLTPPGSAGLSRGGHTTVAVCLGFILMGGVLSNCLALLVFARFRCLWTPINLVLLNISLSDALVCILGTPLSFVANVRGHWVTGESGCRWYAFANSVFGIVSLVSLSLLSYERYIAVLHSSQSDVSDFRKAWLCVGGSWLYSLLWTLPPFLGWGSYGPEGPGTTCSVQWHIRSFSSISYVLCLFIFCLLLPLLLMIYSYGRILTALRKAGKINLVAAQRREQRILFMVLSMVFCYVLCWMPYGVVALMATFGRTVTPTASVVPSVLAKFSTVVNPVIYIFFNTQFSRCLIAFIKCNRYPEDHPTQRTQLSDMVRVRNQTSLSSSPAHVASDSRQPEKRNLFVHYTP